MKLTKYTVPCKTEGKNVETTYMESFPTRCPNDPTHVIYPSSIRVLNTLSKPESVTINQVPRDINVGGHVRVDCHNIEIRSDTQTSYDISYPYPVCLNTMSVYPTSGNKGGYITVIQSPDTQIGVLKSLPIPEDNKIIVTPSQQSILEAKAGYSIRLKNHPEDDAQCLDLGTILSVSIRPDDSMVISFTGRIPSQCIISALTPVLVSKPLITSLKIVNTDPITFGMSRLTGTSLRDGDTIRILYGNLAKTNQDLSIHLEITY